MSSPVLPEPEQHFLDRLIADFPQFHFRFAKRFSYRAQPKNHPKPAKNQPETNVRAASKPPLKTATIFLGQPQPFFTLQTLHELGHAVNRDRDFKNNISRLKIEVHAWTTAKKIYQYYQQTAPQLLPEPWSDGFVEDSLDTYRDWLHQTSRCKTCGLNRYQTSNGLWHCPYCDTFSGAPKTANIPQKNHKQK